VFLYAYGKLKRVTMKTDPTITSLTRKTSPSSAALPLHGFTIMGTTLSKDGQV
jgi:hypothetical protein